MEHISKHDSEEEREGHNSEQSWVDFLISRDTIDIDNQLEHSCELVQFEISRGFLFTILMRFDLSSHYLFVPVLV